MEHGSTFLADLAIVLVMAAGISVVFRFLRQPVVLGYLLAGVVVGPHLPLHWVSEEGQVEALAEFGVVLVMFSVGLEFSFRRLARVLPAAGLPAVIQMATLAWLGTLIARAFGWSDLESIFLASCLAISSTMVVVRALDEVKVPRASSELALGILVTQDIVAILLIAALTAVVSGSGLETAALASTAGELALFLVALVVVGLLLIPALIRRLAKLGSAEMMVVTVTGIAFGLALLAERMGYSVALGAFIAGALVAEAGQRERIEELVRPLRDLFAAVFFVAIGMAVDPRSLIADLPLGLLVVAAIVIGQLVSVTLGGVLAGRGLAVSVRSGAALGQIGEFSFIIATLGVASGVVRPALYSTIVLAALMTTFTTPISLRFADRIACAIDGVLPPRIRTLLTLYGSWLEALPAGIKRGVHRSRPRRLVAALALDTVVLIALTVVGSLAHRPLGATVAEAVGTAPRWGTVVVIATVVVLSLPFMAGVLRSGRSLGQELAAVALPAKSEGPDLANAPRQAMTVLLGVAVVSLVALLYVMATQPFLPVGWGLVVLAVTATGLGIACWRTSGNLDQHVRAGAQAFAAGLLGRSSSGRPRGAPEISQLLVGLGDLTAHEMQAGSYGIDRTLAEINLRGHTGATVLAVRRAEEVHSLPGGDWTVAPGDLLGLTGSHSAVEAARELLRSGPEP
ncbi:MAG: cation:proton antiporter [Acidobacteriota bacterium]